MPTTIINDYAISCDGLKLMLIAPENKTNTDVHPLSTTIQTSEKQYVREAFTLSRQPSNNASFHMQFEVSHAGQCLGCIYTDPTKKYGYNQHLRPFHIANEAFYTMNFAQLISEFLAVFGLVVNNISKLDICIYTQQVDPAAFIKSFTQKTSEYQRVKLKGDKGFSIAGSEDESNGSQNVTTYIQRDSKRVQLASYNKTREIEAKRHKPYLSIWFKEHGLTKETPVYSLEQSIQAAALSSYRPYAVTEEGEILSPYRASLSNAVSVRFSEKTKTNIDLSRLQEPAYLASLFREFFTLDIRKRDRSRISNCTKVKLIDFAIFGQTQVNKTVTNDKAKNSLKRQKRTMNNCLELFNETSSPLYLTVAADIATRYGLNSELTDSVAKLRVSQTVKEQGIDFLLDNYELLNALNMAA